MSRDEDPARRLVAELRDLRYAAGLSQREVCARLHLSASVVANWERGHCTPSLRDMQRWAEVVGAELVVGVRLLPPTGGTR